MINKLIKLTIITISLIVICNFLVCSIDDCNAKDCDTECLCACQDSMFFEISKYTIGYIDYAFSVSSQNQYINQKNLIKSIFRPPLQLI